MAYVYYNVNPLEKHTGDCVVRALSFILKQSWDDTYWDLCRKGFERAEMPSWNSSWWSLLRDKGFTRHIIPDTCPDCYTVEDFSKDHPKGRYIVFIPHSQGGSGHVVAVEKGNIYDTWDSSNQIPLVYWEKE